ncbi:glycerophosphoryl diester phosphodiesterase [Labrys okinawensis]|uniref:glycerophosphoryl diester phosphodiesterase n=1 Tax=Labrys okinawensis TaxID=346911 RepID=UPI0039BD6712
MLGPIPRVIGHRGAAAHAPENTLEAIRCAAAFGVEMVEVDVQLTRDEVPVIIHDDTLDRTTTGTGPVFERSWKEIRELDAGASFGRAFAGEHIPTLHDVLALCRELKLGLNVEIKPYPGTELRTAEIALSVLEDFGPLEGSLLVSSFSVESLKAAHGLAPHLPLGYLIYDRPDNWAAIADEVGAATINFDHTRETPQTIAAYGATGRPLLSYTVNTAARAKELFSLGVSGVFTDFPGRILKVAEE